MSESQHARARHRSGDRIFQDHFQSSKVAQMSLAEQNKKEDLKVEAVAKGLFVVRNAYAGEYDFFDSREELFSSSKKNSQSGEKKEGSEASEKASE
jgi:hypothetical protein